MPKTKIISKTKKKKSTPGVDFASFKEAVLIDYRLACVSREMSILGRKEVLTGKAKFGIFGDGKEIPQIAMAKAFKEGDFRAGYYRDQTFALASGLVTLDQLLAQLYANPTLSADPHSAGRQMNNHFASRNLNQDGSWKNLKNQKNSAADNSPTASQMIRSLGLALASKRYRQLHEKGEIVNSGFSDNGNEICFVTIGDASTSEGHFWEVINAAGVLRVPLIVNVWDDGYGISVPRELQTTKGSISEVLEGFRVNEKGEGFDIYVLKAWDYPSLVKTYITAAEKVRKTHIPAIFHIKDVTQPLGHSTSGSHERYKSPERLGWEKDTDCITRFRQWILKKGIASNEELNALKHEAKKEVYDTKKIAWNLFTQPIVAEMDEVVDICNHIATKSRMRQRILREIAELSTVIDPVRKDLFEFVYKILIIGQADDISLYAPLVKWKNEQVQVNKERYNSYLFTQSIQSAINVKPIKVSYPENPKYLSGYQVLNACFRANFKRDPRILAFGEDLGKIGDVNQAFAGLQEEFGDHRVYDTGIREASIIGEGIGLAMRGLRPIAEIQYLDYLLYGLQPLSDDLATLSYRTKAGQKAPLIVRTRGHRLEGIWHTGSPMAMILGALRGMHVCVPRNMTQAAGFYNTLLRSDEPALVIECLNGYRLKEKIPDNPGDFMVPLGVPDILTSGTDVTLVTYGSCVRIAKKAIEKLDQVDISVELIDVQTLLPFDRFHKITESLRKTNRLIILDEDVPGGGSAYILQQIQEVQQGFQFLATDPITITAKEHRTPFGTDGDYFCKPNAENVFEEVYKMMHEAKPDWYPQFL